jgi:hypothetical protein
MTNMEKGPVTFGFFHIGHWVFDYWSLIGHWELVIGH